VISKQKVVIRAFVLCVLSVVIVNAEYSPNVSISNELDFLIARLSAVHSVNVPKGYYSRPVNYAALNQFFRTADSLDSLGRLSKSESQQLKRAEKFNGFQKNALKWSDDKKDIHLKANLNLLGDSRLESNDSNNIGMKGIISPSLAGNLGKLSFYSGIDVWTEYRSDTLFKGSSYQPYDGLAYNMYGRNTEESNIRSSDVPIGGIRYDAGSIQLETAIDRLKFGPSVYYPLTLSGMTPPITYARAVMDMNVLTYTHIAGLLKSQKDRDKYIYTHRLELAMWKSRMQIGINEVIINGSSTNQFLGDSNRVSPSDTGKTRGWEWAYLIPFVPFKFVEHYAGDRDNAAISFDFNIRYPDRFRWYGEFFLDDMLNPLKIFSDDWGNKWAATFGFQYFGQVLAKDLVLTVEYSHVEPWVYTHFYGGSHNFAHFGQNLGSPLGPNSQAIVISTIVQLNTMNALQLKFTNTGKNSSVRGGNITDVFQDDPEDSTAFHDSEKKRFLGPGTVWSSKPAIQWSFNSFGLFNVNLEYAIDIKSNKVTNEIGLWGGFRF
jgi:hypothetical protein